MSEYTNISWTQATWNPVTGCNKISLGCQNCYANALALRLKSIGAKHYENGFEVTIHPDSLALPLKWKKPHLIFANSMSDLFHEKVPFNFLLKIFEVMNKTPIHKYQILTKRPERLLLLNNKLPWSNNILMGVTTESKDYLYRIDMLRKCKAKTKFLSLEPLLSDMPNLDLSGINWVILGGESGPHARPMKKEWVLSVQKQCKEQNVAFFFKQWGGNTPDKGGNILNGKLYEDYPVILKEQNLFDI